MEVVRKGTKSRLRDFLPRRIKPHRILAGPLRNRWIVTSWFDYPAAILGRTEKALLKWFAQNVGLGETWLDVGAHYGYTSIALCELVGETGRVFAFEPMLSTVGHLCQTRFLNGLSRLTIIPIALGMEDGLEFLHLPTVRGMVDSTIPVEDRWQEPILASALDWLWLHIHDQQPQINGIKIDVQGMEFEALRGMKKVLRRNRPKLVVEFHPGVDRKEILNLLEEIGYSTQAVPIEPLEKEIEPLFIYDRSYAFFPQV